MKHPPAALTLCLATMAGAGAFSLPRASAFHTAGRVPPSRRCVGRGAGCGTPLTAVVPSPRLAAVHGESGEEEARPGGMPRERSGTPRWAQSPAAEKDEAGGGTTVGGAILGYGGVDEVVNGRPDAGINGVGVGVDVDVSVGSIRRTGVPSYESSELEPAVGETADLTPLSDSSYGEAATEVSSPSSDGPRRPELSDRARLEKMALTSAEAAGIEKITESANEARGERGVNGLDINLSKRETTAEDDAKQEETRPKKQVVNNEAVSVPTIEGEDQQDPNPDFNTQQVNDWHGARSEEEEAIELNGLNMAFNEKVEKGEGHCHQVINSNKKDNKKVDQEDIPRSEQVNSGKTPAEVRLLQESEKRVAKSAGADESEFQEMLGRARDLKAKAKKVASRRLVLALSEEGAPQWSQEVIVSSLLDAFAPTTTTEQLKSKSNPDILACAVANLGKATLSSGMAALQAVGLVAGTLTDKEVLDVLGAAAGTAYVASSSVRAGLDSGKIGRVAESGGTVVDSVSTAFGAVLHGLLTSQSSGAAMTAASDATRSLATVYSAAMVLGGRWIDGQLRPGLDRFINKREAYRRAAHKAADEAERAANESRRAEEESRRHEMTAIRQQRMKLDRERREAVVLCQTLGGDKDERAKLERKYFVTLDWAPSSKSSGPASGPDKKEEERPKSGARKDSVPFFLDFA